jgi:hypothetical protein
VSVACPVRNRSCARPAQVTAPRRADGRTCGRRQAARQVAGRDVIVHSCAGQVRDRLGRLVAVIRRRARLALAGRGPAVPTPGVGALRGAVKGGSRAAVPSVSISPDKSWKSRSCRLVAAALVAGVLDAVPGTTHGQALLAGRATRTCMRFQ